MKTKNESATTLQAQPTTLTDMVKEALIDIGSSGDARGVRAWVRAHYPKASFANGTLSSLVTMVRDRLGYPRIGRNAQNQHTEATTNGNGHRPNGQVTGKPPVSPTAAVKGVRAVRDALKGAGLDAATVKRTLGGLDSVCKALSCSPSELRAVVDFLAELGGEV